jgi:hypothetical protein
VKYERKLRECVRDFCLYCRHHRKKTAVCYYDSAAPGNSRAVNDEDFRTAVCDEFEKQGWDVIPVHTGKPVKHMEKWLSISPAFKGQSGLFPMLNRENSEALIPAMEQTGTRNGPEGFKKDRTGEKLAETEEDRPEYRTGGTGARDMLFTGMGRFPQLASAGFVAGSFG